jgi:hypothetical protein
MKRHLLYRIALMLPSVLLAFNSIGQVVINPSDSTGYDEAKRQLTAANTSARALRGGVAQQQTARTSAAATTSALSSPLTAVTGSNGCFIPVDASYTPVPRNDDGSFGPIALPFTFSLYGTNYTRVWINTNGNLTFKAAYSPYSTSGFPFSVPMVAPFWSDVDTSKPITGQIFYKLSATNLIVTWNAVSCYPGVGNKTNSFQAIIGTSTDALLGPGQNVSLRYGDMQWTTGSASGGVDGFGGSPATVGINKGSDQSYVQVGRFSLNNADYDGPGGANDGVDYLDGHCYGLNVSNTSNVPPSPTNLPLNNTVNVACGQTITINPQFLAPEVNQNTVLSVNTGGLCNTTVATTTGISAGASITITGADCNVGTHPLVLTATDDGSPVGVTTVTLTVVVSACCDLQLSAVPTPVSCPSGTDGALNLTVSNGKAPLTYRWTSGTATEDLVGMGAGTYSVTVTDANGCTATGTYTISQVDAVAPTARTHAFRLALGAAGTAALRPADVDDGSFDNCTIASVAVTPNSFTCASVGPNTVTLTITDASGNVSTAPAIVTVVDAIAPTITAPAAVTVSADAGQCSASGVVLGKATAIDNCSGIVVHNDAPAVFPIGTTTVTWTATDASGNAATATQLVQVQDTEQPVLRLPASLVRVAAATACGAVVTFSPSATDNCAGATVVASPASGSTFPVGTTTVQVTATDASGNQRTGSFLVTVNDVIPPSVATRNVSLTLVNGIASLTAAQVDNGSSDACGLAALSLSRTTFSCADLGTNTVTLTATDSHGNVTSAPAVVTVLGSIPAPTITLTPTSSVYTGGVPSTLYLGYGPQTVKLMADGGVSYLWSPAAGLSSKSGASQVFTATTAGTFTYTVTATSASGCTATQRITLTVVDASCGNDNGNNIKVLVCHNGHEICISSNAVDAHLTQHADDQLGPCNAATSAARASAVAAPLTANEDAPFPTPALAATGLLVYPNPTVDQATISFRSPLDGNAQVQVYNLLGQCVATLYKGKVVSGEQYSFSFDSRSLPTGLYECHLVLNGKVEVKRLAIAR